MAFGPSRLISAGFDALGDAGQLNPWTPDDPDLPPMCRLRSPTRAATRDYDAARSWA